ncbi:hypothetical protein TRIUR3_29529 [Triticum urartu]|uniref:Uncharacterized protein n=1 Tax=Triticum urartu TaxID=4572 RepID=M7YG63_TRIUA|nr:hypothetical protein TRIUR3_29529 [Triticum urartu]
MDILEKYKRVAPRKVPFPEHILISLWDIIIYLEFIEIKAAKYSFHVVDHRFVAWQDKKYRDSSREWKEIATTSFWSETAEAFDADKLDTD